MDKDWDGSVGESGEILRFTDHDIFVSDGTYEYTPLSISFDRLNEDFSMQTDSVSVTIDNINGALTTEALASEWRNNPAKIMRVIYEPASETIGSDVYDYGISDNTISDYPKLDISTLTKDQYTLFKGVIDTFTATEQALTGTLTTQFSLWAKPFPERTYSQNEFTTIVDAMTNTIYWGTLVDPNL